MIDQNNKNKELKIDFSEKSILVIEKFLEKYNLTEIEEKEIDKISKLGDVDKALEIFENLPGTKISQIIKDFAEQKVSLNEIPSLIEKSLNVSDQEAEEMTKYLNENLLVLIKKLNNKSYAEEQAKEIFSEARPDPLPKTEESMNKEEEKERFEQPENDSIEEDDSSFLNEEMMKIREKYRKKPIIEEVVKEKKEPKKEIKKDRPKKSSKGDSYRESIE